MEKSITENEMGEGGREVRDKKEAIRETQGGQSGGEGNGGVLEREAIVEGEMGDGKREGRKEIGVECKSLGLVGEKM